MSRNSCTVDLFGWSTSSTFYGINNSESDNSYTGNFVDWGNRPITNGGNTANSGWRTMSSVQWAYLLESRTNAALKKGLGCVNGRNDLILLPDNWMLPDSLTFTPGQNGYGTNVYSADQWAEMEANGAVFLPAAGERSGGGSTIVNSVSDIGSGGYYWTSTDASSVHTGPRAWSFHFIRNLIPTPNLALPHSGYNVRLVKNK